MHNELFFEVKRVHTKRVKKGKYNEMQKVRRTYGAAVLF